MPMLPTFSLDPLTQELMPRIPAKLKLKPWILMPRATTFFGGSVRPVNKKNKNKNTYFNKSL